MTDKIKSNPTTLEPSLDELLIYEATTLTRVSVPCADNVKMGDLVSHETYGSHIALRDAQDGSTIINPINCVFNAQFLNDSTRKALNQKNALMYGIVYRGLSIMQDQTVELE